MVPADKILQTAIDEDCDLIGLSGLITPSLDEMVHVAREMRRREFETPLLIGGATTSREHCAVKIAPEYEESTAHVLDASKAVEVVSSLLDQQRKVEFDRKNRAAQAKLREVHGKKSGAHLRAYDEACANKLTIDWRQEDLAEPSFHGRQHVADAVLSEIAEYIDWTYLFSLWELNGRYPDILEHPTKGAAARELFDNATQLLAKVIDEHHLRAHAIYGFWPAASVGDDILLYADADRREVLCRLHTLRQQLRRPDGGPNLALADFIAPADSGLTDYLGAFAVSVVGAEEMARAFERELDDYNAIMIKGLADRLAEAYAELLHARVRREWGYGESEQLSREDILKERFRGIRPAPGYPACPDHSEKRTITRLLQASSIGLELTESCAMTPPSSVCGLYFAHPEARYFHLGKIGRDQVESYAARKGVEVGEVERWLAPAARVSAAVADGRAGLSRQSGRLERPQQVPASPGGGLLPRRGRRRVGRRRVRRAGVVQPSRRTRGARARVLRAEDPVALVGIAEEPRL